MFEVGKTYKTRGGWDCVLSNSYTHKQCAHDGDCECSKHIFSHKKDFSNKSDDWQKWFIRDNQGLRVWHEADGSCRQHNGCLSGEKDRDWDVISG